MKPFYIRKTDAITDAMVAEVFDKAVLNGANLLNSVPFCSPSNFSFFGVDDFEDTIIDDDVRDFGDGAIEITIEQVDKHLELT